MKTILILIILLLLVIAGISYLQYLDIVSISWHELAILGAALGGPFKYAFNKMADIKEQEIESQERIEIESVNRLTQRSKNELL